MQWSHLPACSLFYPDCRCSVLLVLLLEGSYLMVGGTSCVQKGLALFQHYKSMTWLAKYWSIIQPIKLEYIKVGLLAAWALDTIQDFWEKLGMKKCIHIVEISVFFTNSCHCQTYQNFEQPPQTSQNSDFQSLFSVLKIGWTFLKNILD